MKKVSSEEEGEGAGGRRRSGLKEGDGDERERDTPANPGEWILPRVKWQFQFCQKDLTCFHTDKHTCPNTEDGEHTALLLSDLTPWTKNYKDVRLVPLNYQDWTWLKWRASRQDGNDMQVQRRRLQHSSDFHVFDVEDQCCFMLKAGEALYAWTHDPSPFDCAIRRSYCTLSKDEICKEKTSGCCM